jgi:hypothetical protein
MSDQAGRTVRLTLSPKGRAEGWGLGVVYGEWPPCSVCGSTFAQGERLVFRAAPKRFLCGRCAAVQGVMAEEGAH